MPPVTNTDTPARAASSAVAETVVAPVSRRAMTAGTSRRDTGARARAEFCEPAQVGVVQADAGHAVDDGHGGGRRASRAHDRLYVAGHLQVLGVGHAVRHDGALESHHGAARGERLGHGRVEHHRARRDRGAAVARHREPRFPRRSVGWRRRQVASEGRDPAGRADLHLAAGDARERRGSERAARRSRSRESTRASLFGTKRLFLVNNFFNPPPPQEAALPRRRRPAAPPAPPPPPGRPRRGAPRPGPPRRPPRPPRRKRT